MNVNTLKLKPYAPPVPHEILPVSAARSPCPTASRQAPKFRLYSASLHSLRPSNIFRSFPSATCRLQEMVVLLLALSCLSPGCHHLCCLLSVLVIWGTSESGAMLPGRKQDGSLFLHWFLLNFKGNSSTFFPYHHNYLGEVPRTHELTLLLHLSLQNDRQI